METNSRKSQFYRNIQTWIFISLAFFNQAKAADIYPSHYESFIGEKFFLLSDTTFSSNEEAKVRLEIRKNYHNRNNVKNYGGADIAIYKVKDPIKFLKAQKNLHRISTKYNYKPKGIIANGLSYVWDSFYKKSRLAWQRILSFNARKSAIETTENFRQKPAHTYKTTFKHYKQFRKMEGYDLLQQFRYPITEAKPIQPPKVKLAGSSHNFNQPNPGNVYIPLGKLQSGLYLVEAVIGDHRANTLVFVSNSVLISKTSSQEMFMWTVDKDSGNPVPNASVFVSDGLGILKNGKTNKQGVLKINLKTPELVYFIGQDAKGGVYISENYYYDSEIYSDKLYAFTDRPLYRPGSKVFVKVIGRKFKNSTTSEWLKNKTFKAKVIYSAGTILISKNFKVNQKTVGGEFSFRLPRYALPGGYTILLKDKLKSYTSEFRVSKYTKPHYNIDILFTQKKFKLGEQVSGVVKLTYANGKPVKDADVDFVVRRQKLNVIEGERDAESLFPIKVKESKFKIGESGFVDFKLDPVNIPSRYIVSIKAKDKASFRVSATKEILVELDTPTYRLISENLFSNQGKSVKFKLEENLTVQKKQKGNLTWRSVRLEDQSKQEGQVSGDEFKIKFKQAGTYKILVLNQAGKVVGGKSHIVRGKDLQTLPGTVQIVLDKEEYDLDDKVRALINFSNPVQNALLTLERDKVENYSISGKSSDWVNVEKVSAQQWIAQIPVKKLFAPNITFSVLFVKNGRFVFNNKGIKVKMPKIKVSYKFDKLEYAAREKVKVGIKTTFLGKPISSNVTMSIVDEMIYVLQPELAPDITDFFYHRRRNQVKTSSSLDFHTYDASGSATGRYDYSSSYSNRPLKMRERPRREDVDTAFWKTNIKTNSKGEAEIEFALPDSITRWRVTSRAIDQNGVVGQTVAHIQSYQSTYLKWGGLTDFRKGDEPEVSVMAFNMEPTDLTGEINFQGAGSDSKLSKVLSPGINFIPLKFKANKTEDIQMNVKGANFQDSLVKKIEVMPTDWMSLRTKELKLKKGLNSIDLPQGAFNFRLIAFNNLYHRFLKTSEELISYPHGCVEQTASKLIPLSIAYGIIKRAKNKKGDLGTIREKILNGRNHLLKMAKQGGYFGWYNDFPKDSFMTAYAYLADFYAGKVLGLSFDERHWEKVTQVFKDQVNVNVLRNAIVLWISAHVGNPVQSIIAAQIELIESELKKNKFESKGNHRNYIMSYKNSKAHYQLSSIILKLASIKLGKNGYQLEKTALDKVNLISDQALEAFKGNTHPLFQAASLSLRASKLNKQELILEAENILKPVDHRYSTADRAISLILMHEALGEMEFSEMNLALEGPVQKIKSIYGLDSWQVRGAKKVDLTLKTPISEEIDFRLYYDTFKKDQHQLQVKITRNIYSLDKVENKYIATKVDLSTALSTEGKYIDEIIIEPEEGVNGLHFQHGMIEVPLPPGANINTDLGKISVVKITESGEDKSITIDEISRPGHLVYKIPIWDFSYRTVFRHTMQFSAKGQFHLPKTRFFQMYNPEKKGYRDQNKDSTWMINVK